MRWQPLTLAFWSYFCNLLVSLQFAIVAWTRLNFAYTPGDAWILTSTPSCLCAFDPAHPGCACSSGLTATSKLIADSVLNVDARKKYLV